jgi:hypothetical protein
VVSVMATTSRDSAASSVRLISSTILLASGHADAMAPGTHLHQWCAALSTARESTATGS